MKKTLLHSLNCAKLMPGGPHKCSCGVRVSLPSANSPEGRKHRLQCARIDLNDGKYDADLVCDCGGTGPGFDVPKVHNHGPSEGPGLGCLEYTTQEGYLRGKCLDDIEIQEATSGYVAKMASPKLPEVSPAGLRVLEHYEGETRTTSPTGGQKGVKEARFDLIPTGALRTLAEHYAVGSAKYSDHNWRKGFDWSKSYAALNRHLNAFWGGEDLDPETGSPHMAAVAWHAFTLLTFQVEQPQFDDRFKTGDHRGSVQE